MAQMQVPILVDWDDIKDHMAKSDIVEVVRCKDCKYNSCSPEDGNACCDTFYGMTDQMGYCHYGERRTDG